MRRLINRHMAAAVVFLGIVVLLTVLPGRTPGVRTLFRWTDSVYLGDKFGHLALFGLLVIVAYGGLRTVMPRFPALIWASGGTFMLGIATELAQLLVRSRSSDWRDLIADWLGVLVAAVAITVYIILREQCIRRFRKY